MHLVFGAAHTQLVLVVDCRIIKIQQRPAFLPDHIGNLLESCAKRFLFLHQRFCLEPIHVFWS